MSDFDEHKHPRGEHGKWAHLAEVGRAEHPNVTEYRSGGIGHLPGDESRSVVGFMDPKALIPYREHSGIQNPGAGDHDEKRIGEIQHDIESGEGIHEPISVEWDANRQHAYIGEGNHRLEAALRAGARTVPVRVNGRGHAERQISEGVGSPLTHTGDFEDDGRPVPGYAPPAVHPAHFDWSPTVDQPSVRASGRQDDTQADRLHGGGGAVADAMPEVHFAGECTGPGPCDTHPIGTKPNWVTKVGGLPAYIRAIAHAMLRNGHSESQAIQIAIGTVKRWAAGGGHVTPATRARAAKAVAEWEAKKAASVGDVDTFTTMESFDLETAPVDELDGPTHAGLVLKANDTGRILMLQRGIKDETDPAAGKWEFPGGGIEPDDLTTLHGAIREWQEEVGQPFPKGGMVADTWTSPNGVYQGHVVVIPTEDQVTLHQGRMMLNPDDPDGDESEQVAWWHPEDAAENPALREECKTTPWDLIANSGGAVAVPVDENHDPDPAAVAASVEAMAGEALQDESEFCGDEGCPCVEDDATTDEEYAEIAAEFGAFNPSLHPRASNGTFAPLGSGAGYQTTSSKGKSENKRVKTVQRALLKAGIGVGVEGVDGMLGPHTAHAISVFQKAHGLHVTGSVDEATWTALGKATKTKAAAKATKHAVARQQRIPGLRAQAPGMLPDSAIPRVPAQVLMPGYKPNPIVAAGNDGRVYHFKHGWIPVDHPGASDKRTLREGDTVSHGGAPHTVTSISEAGKARLRNNDTGGVLHLDAGEAAQLPKPKGTKRAPVVMDRNSAIDDMLGRLRKHGGNMTLLDLALAEGDIEALVAAAIAPAPEIEIGEDVGGGVPFKIPLVLPTGIETGDRREFKAGGVSSRDLPIPLLWQRFTDDGHKQASIVARIDKIEPTKNGLGNAEGVFDTGEDAQEALRLVRGLFLRGVSGDVDKIDAEMSQGEDGKPKVVFDKGRLTAATLVAKPAFAECMIELPGDQEWENNMSRLREEGGAPKPLVAAGGPMHPPRDWFDNPGLTEPTHLEVTDDGRVFGHIAAWDQPHIGMPFQKAPRSSSGYRYFTTGQIKTAEGELVNVGQLTLAGGHADLSYTADMAVKHYDDTNSAVADVTIGEDEFGIWVAGAQRPDLSEAQVRAFRASDPSGDWRPISGNLELVACCQVNVPGFPIPRSRVASGAPGEEPHVLALVAAGAPAVAQRAPHSPHEDLVARVASLEAADTRRRGAIAAEHRATLQAGKAMLIKQTRQALVASADALASVEFDSPIFDADPDASSEDMTGVNTDEIPTTR